jgi:hypothetical protein
MIRIYSIIFCLIFISTNYGCSQDKTATTAEGQTVILKTDGTWHIDANTKLHENSAVTEDGELVLLGGDGKWFLTKVTVPPPSQQQNTYSSAVGVFERNGLRNRRSLCASEHEGQFRGVETADALA